MPKNAFEEIAHQRGDFVALVLEREMPGVEGMELGIGQDVQVVAHVRFRKERVIRAGRSVPRDHVFITTNSIPPARTPLLNWSAACNGSERTTSICTLVHWPQGGATRAWPGIQRARELGYARSIGVSNFGLHELDQVLAAAPMVPVVDQVQFSPFEYRRALLEGAHQRNIVVEAYSPLGTGRHLSNQTVKRIAVSNGRTPAQVLLRWSLQRGLVVIPKSTHRERIQENAQIFDFTLSYEDMAALDALDQTSGTDRALERPWW